MTRFSLAASGELSLGVRRPGYNPAPVENAIAAQLAAIRALGCLAAARATMAP
ncbi:MAG: hypothetical protein KJZ83_23190 [Burkholderiaceae bacterium]|nr:hypothetical protein [Burkholderiaceae bacterium]